MDKAGSTCDSCEKGNKQESPKTGSAFFLEEFPGYWSVNVMGKTPQDQGKSHRKTVVWIVSKAHTVLGSVHIAMSQKVYTWAVGIN